LVHTTLAEAVSNPQEESENVAKSVVLKPREVIAGLRKLGFELFPERGKGSHMFAVKLVVCEDGEPHTIRVMIPRHKRELHPDTLASICARTGLTAEKFKQATAASCLPEKKEAWLKAKVLHSEIEKRRRDTKCPSSHGITGWQQP
jgi:predicted RNA binding protein YcfA (HicA-like mRNA interferase family)